MKVIEVYRPSKTEPNRRPSWNSGLIIVKEPSGKKHQCWDRGSAMRKAADLSTGKELIHENL